MAKAQRIGGDDEFPEVWATSRMILLMEIAATRLMKPIVGAGNMSVGVGVDIKPHSRRRRSIVKSARGRRITGRADKLYKFTIEAFDAAGKVGEGDHTRAIISDGALADGCSGAN